MPRALITGISGQDGSYLAEQLLADGLEVHGLVRAGLGAAAHLSEQVVVHRGDLRDADSVLAAVRATGADEVYHLGAATHVSGEDFHAVVAGGTVNVLDAVAEATPEARVFCASSAEVFGAVTSAPQDESTPLRPRNAYGEAKVAALEAARAARAGGLHVGLGILFNHESPRRPHDFVTRKITWHAAAIAAGEATELRLGSLDARRDWGYAPEYMDCVRRIARADAPGDFVVATGVLHSVRELVELAFARVGVPVEGHVVVDPEFVRPDEAVPLVGDASRARRELGWLASTPFEDLIAEMVDNDIERMRG